MEGIKSTIDIACEKRRNQPVVETIITEAEEQKKYPVGKHNDWPDDKFDAKELAMGIEVEKEHTNDTSLTKLIAKDHLAEIPDYYTRLKKMEDEAKKKH